MPRLPKPARLRQNHERKDFGLVSIAPMGLEVPEPTRGWLAATREGWDAFWTSPLAQTVTPATDMPAIRRLFGLRDERERLGRLLRAEPFMEGSKGQAVANPLYPTYAAMNAEVRQLEDRFGLTPLARLKLGVTFGDAARSLADLNAEAAATDDEPDELEDADLLLTLAAGGVAEPRPAGDPVDGAKPRPRARRHPR